MRAPGATDLRHMAPGDPGFSRYGAVSRSTPRLPRRSAPRTSRYYCSAVYLYTRDRCDKAPAMCSARPVALRTERHQAREQVQEPAETEVVAAGPDPRHA